MASIAHPQTAHFRALVADVFGDDRATNDAPTTTPNLPISDRQIYRETVASVAQRAKAAMASCLHARIDKAEALVLAGDVTLLSDGHAQVASQTHGQTTYLVVNGTCPCKDRALDGWCKHRLSHAIFRRVQQAFALAEARLAHEAPVVPSTPDDSGCFTPLDTDGTPCCAVSAVCPGHEAPVPPTPPVPPVLPLPEAPASANVRFFLHGREVQFTLRDSCEKHLLERLEVVLAKFPVEAPASVIVPPTTAQAHMCSMHRAPLKESSKAPGTFYCPKKLADGTYCLSRYPATARQGK